MKDDKKTYQREISPFINEDCTAGMSLSGSSDFFDRIAKIVEQAQSNIQRSVNVAMCVTYYEVGRLIVEQEQSGASRAAYGKKLLDELSSYLTERCGKGWSVGNLKNARQFYIYFK